MMSDMLLKKLELLDAPRPPSAARLAAEAFFAATPATAPDEADMTEVPRRRDAVATDREVCPETPNQSKPRDEEETRAPRVFRIDSVAPAAAPVSAPAEPEARPDQLPVADTLPQNSAVSRLPRRKARRLHGEVTIIRPVQGSTSQGSVAALPVQAEPQLAARTDHGIEPVPSRTQRRQPRPHMEQSDDAWPHYPRLMARIRMLEMEAQVLKAREAAEAAEWIRQAIAAYGLTAQDLGFVDSATVVPLNPALRD